MCELTHYTSLYAYDVHSVHFTCIQELERKNAPSKLDTRRPTIFSRSAKLCDVVSMFSNKTRAFQQGKQTI